MTNLMEIYKCEHCGIIVEVLHVGGGKLICCGEPMVLQVSQTDDAANEKHVPVLESTPEGTEVKVGSVPHPMEKNHYIEWIQLLGPDGKYAPRQFLRPGQQAAARFKLSQPGIVAREYCSVHGLWRS